MDIRKTKVVLDPSEIPYDIAFVIEECGSVVKAHKFIMAMGSPMCMRQFYGDFKESTEKKIVIKSTTKDAFVTIIDFFYGKEVDWAKKTIEELFEIANMAEKYQVDALKKEIEEAVRKYPLTKETVVTVTSVAENFSQFENLSNIILKKSREFLLSALKVPDDFIGFADKYAGTELADVAFKLLAGVKKDNLICCELKTCRRGKPMLKISDFVVGEKVKFNPESKDPLLPFAVVMVLWGGKRDEGTVESIDKNSICVDKWGGSQRYNIVIENVASFLFCKC